MKRPSFQLVFRIPNLPALISKFVESPAPTPKHDARRSAVMDSAKQLFGAMRWLREHPDRVFSDAECTEPLRVPLPDRSRAKYHLVAVACLNFARNPISFFCQTVLESDRLRHGAPECQGSRRASAWTCF